MNLAFLSALASGDLANAVVASKPGGIEAQEAAGQAELADSDRLPKKLRGGTREQLQAIGFVFGADIDNLFVQAQLPPGWSKRMENSYYTTVLDEKGRDRARLFYKAAFYDRRADMSMVTRFSIATYQPGKDEQHRCAAIMNSGAVMLDLGEWPMDNWNAREEKEKAGQAWLEENYPHWQDPFAHW